jgi:serine/threonine protein phosphatase 1
MIGRLSGIGRRPEPRGAEAPAGTCLFAIGDIHGRIDLLRALERSIADEALRRQAPRNVVIYLGDYVDRGAHSRAVIEHLLREKLPGFETVHLKGNHEDVMLRFLEDVEIGPNWLAFGGMETLESYGVEPPFPHADVADLERAQRALGEALPPAHRAFLDGLRLSHVEGGYVFVHAGLKPGVALAQQRAEDMLWIREPFLRSDADFGAVVVHGHTIVPEPVIRPNRIGIDTGAFASGRLTCLVAQGAARDFLQT